MNLMYMRVLGANQKFVIMPPSSWIANNHPFVANLTIDERRTRRNCSQADL